MDDVFFFFLEILKTRQNTSKKKSRILRIELLEMLRSVKSSFYAWFLNRPSFLCEVILFVCLFSNFIIHKLCSKKKTKKSKYLCPELSSPQMSLRSLLPSARSCPRSIYPAAPRLPCSLHTCPQSGRRPAHTAAQRCRSCVK